MVNRARLRQIKLFAGISSSPSDLAKLILLGVARGHPFGSGDAIGRLGKLFGQTIVIRPRNLRGLKAVINPRDLGHLISLEEVLVDCCYDLSLIPFQPEVVYDCGAHIGLFSLLAASWYPKAHIVAIEPNPANIVFIKAQLAINSVSITIENAAVSIRDGEGWFKWECSNSGSLQNADRRNSKGNVRVRTVKPHSLIGDSGKNALLLKLDIEGEELNILPELIPVLPTQCAIFFEVHGGEAAWNEFDSRLKNAGFQVRQTRERYPFADGVAIRN